MKDLFGGGITGPSKHTVIAGKRLCAGVARRMGRGLTMPGKLIDRPCVTMPDICVTTLNKVSSPSPLRKIDYPALTGLWLRFAVISM